MIVKSLNVAGIAIAVLMGGAISAHAEEFKNKSRVVHCAPSMSVEDVLKRPDGSVVRKTSGWCISTGDSPYPFDYIKLLCTSVTEIAADGKPVGSHGFCDGTSTKGDRYASWTIYDPASNQGRWGFFDGNGAYAGVKGGGTYKVAARSMT